MPSPIAIGAALVVAMLAVFTGGSIDRAVAVPQQEAQQEPHVVERLVRVVEHSPRIGKAGTRVTLTARRLPSLTPVQIVIGATRSGFEGLTLAQTSIDGDLRATVEIPDWAHRDQAHRFIVFNAYFSSVLAESDIIHVTDAEGRVVREGTVAGAGTGCATLEGDDGVHYRLVGRTDSLVAGDRAVVEGVIRESEEACGANIAFDLVLDSSATPDDGASHGAPGSLAR